MVREMNAPKNVNLDFEDFCEGCDSMALRTVEVGYDWIKSMNDVHWIVGCDHMVACRRIYNLMKGDAE